MTDTEVRSADSGAGSPRAPRPPHPLDPASAAEYRAGLRILADAGLLTESTRFAYYGLEEPPKGEVLAYSAGRGGRPDRRLRAFLIDVVTGESADVVVSVTRHEVVASRTLDPLTDGRVPILDQDFALAEELVHADPDWRAAMARRGLSDVSKIRACPLTAGSYGVADEQARRMVRVLAFVQAREHDLAWAHPVDGVTAYVDLIERRVFTVIDELDLPVPRESGDYEDPEVRGPLRTTLRPIEITQPEGPSFTLDGSWLEWQGWSLRVGFDAREGLTLHQISLDDQGRRRPVIYRASIPEMVVPYGDPAPTRYWQNYFDAGEYLVGKWANSLELGCDCLGEIAYLDATVAGDDGEPRTISNAICIHEEDFGILWKHTDIYTGSAQSRRQRRLVISFFTTVGNYDYGFYWYFYLDGTIECEVKLTGVLFTSAYPGDGFRYATQVAPGLGAPALLAAPGSSLYRRAAFATNHLWVTRYDPAHRYPAGDFVNQHPGGAGIPAFVTGDHDIDGADIVLWHTFGPAHFPRPEEWPVMPVAHCGFTLKPAGFFDRNPTLDVPPGTRCHPAAPAAPGD